MSRPIELLIPASSLDLLKTAVIFGADAVYIGGEAFGLRAKAKNFSMEEMAEATIDMLLDVIRKKSKSRHLIFEGTLIEGQSVRNIRENEGGANYESKWNTASDQ